MRMRYIFILFMVGVLVLLQGQSGPERQRVLAAEPFNIVFIMTDDMRWDSLCGMPDELADICALPVEDHPMPTVETELMANGVVFTDAVVTNPLCCPSRASFLSGGFYSHHTNVLSNSLPNGGAASFADTVTLSTLLQ